MNVKDDDNTINIPFWKCFFYPFKEISKNSHNFLTLTGLFAFITTILSFFTGNSSGCKFGEESQIFCTSSISLFIVFALILLLGISLYSYRILMITQHKAPLKEIIKKYYHPQDTKTIITIILNLLVWGIIAYSAYSLDARTPTPNFYAELIYFIFFSGIIILCFAYLVNNVTMLRYILGKKWLVLNQTFWPIFDNLVKFMLWPVLYSLFFGWLAKASFSYLLTLDPNSNIIFFIFSDFTLYFITYSIFAFWILHLVYIEKTIFKED